MNSFGPEFFSGSGNKPYGQRISYIGLFTIKRNLSGHAGDGGIWCIINTTNYCRLIKLPFIDLKVDCRRRKKTIRWKVVFNQAARTCQAIPYISTYKAFIKFSFDNFHFILIEGNISSHYRAHKMDSFSSTGILWWNEAADSLSV